ncbi:MCM2/3/5 family-domain-containing protein [Cladochytrium replicatum]|nr:MCM2/3/5 family-domain-containing protein [Cladochytrium replicatum]
MTTIRQQLPANDDIAEQFSLDLVDLCRPAILAILAQPDDTAHYSIELDLQIYAEKTLWMCERIVEQPTVFLPLLDRGAQVAQHRVMRDSDIAKHLKVKEHLHVRLTRAPPVKEIVRVRIPRSEDVGRLVSLKGTVTRTGLVQMLESVKKYECSKCKRQFPVASEREQFNVVPKPTKCGAIPAKEGCESGKFKEVSDEDAQKGVCRDYQEIRVQEQLTKLGFGTIPRSISVVLEDDLVDVCKAGDEVTIIAVVMTRWKRLISGDRCNVELALWANHITVHSEQRSHVVVTDELKAEFLQYWEKNEKGILKGRNEILKSVCPRVYGLFLVKLAVMLVLVGGVRRSETGGMQIRGDAHLLLVGDPGTAKSQFLRFAAKLAPRSVLTTGIGSTNAGLTVAAVKETGEWQLEAGALVLADRGVCCIDEFGSVREHDKTAIHEAMEQQTISVAKAGLVCKLNTRCAVIAATNPKGKYDPTQNVSVNIALGSPLLSRFDLVLVLMDTQNDDWDNVISSFILAAESAPDGVGLKANSANIWPLEKLQAYLAFVKAYCPSPVLTEECNEVLKQYYRTQRAADSRNAARTTIRLLESLIRLAQAHARLTMQASVTVRDAIAAVLLMEASTQSSSLVPGLSTLHTKFADDPEAEYAELERSILDQLQLSHLRTAPTQPSESQMLLQTPPDPGPRITLGDIDMNERREIADGGDEEADEEEEEQRELERWSQMSAIGRKRRQEREDAAKQVDLPAASGQQQASGGGSGARSRLDQFRFKK